MTEPVDLETVRCETVADGVVLLVLNRPDHANGVVPALARDLSETLDRLEPDPGVRAVVLTGAGRQFCAGADLEAMREHLEHELPRTGEPYNARVIFPVIERLVASRLPTIAAVNGGATAGGLDLALACDLRIASSAAKLGHTYINIGLPPGNGGTWFLTRLVGPAVAAELALTGEVVDAGRALSLGLVSRVVEPDDLIPAAVGTAALIAAKSRAAVEATKQSLRSAWQVDLASLLAANYRAHVALQPGPDVAEGVAAFLERRPPLFNREPPTT